MQAKDTKPHSIPRAQLRENVRALRVVIYIRVSGRSQEDHHSLTVQLADCRRYAHQMGWEIVCEFREVQSGLDTGRDQYQEMLALIRSGAVDAVLIWKLDRFGRDDGEAITRGNEMDRLRVKLVSATQGEMDPLTRGILFVVAKNESRTISQRVKPMMRQHVSEGLWPTRPPFGYRMAAGHPGVLEVYDPEAEVVREMFGRYADGESMVGLRCWLDTLAVRPRQAVYYTTAWVGTVLRNHAYRGFVEYDKTARSRIEGRFKRDAAERLLVPGVHDALVSEDLWRRVQERLAAPRFGGAGSPGHNTGQFLLTGVVRCGICGGGMYGLYNNVGKLRAAGKPMRGFQYKCARKGHPMASGHRLDAYVLDALASFPVGAEAAAAVQELLDAEAATRPARRHDLEEAQAKQVRRRKKLTLLLVDDEITKADYESAIGEIDAALGLVERELAALEPAPETTGQMAAAAGWLALVEHLGEMPVKLEIEEKAALVAATIRRVVFDGKGAEPRIEWQDWAKAVRERAGIMSNGSATGGLQGGSPHSPNMGTEYRWGSPPE
jgi:DNA invertase Pin-like site-specific DNA recombinase